MTELKKEALNKLKETFMKEEDDIKRILEKYTAVTDIEIDEIEDENDAYIKITERYYEDDDETPLYKIARIQGYHDVLLEIGIDIIEVYLTGALKLTKEELSLVKELVIMDGVHAEEKLEKYKNILNRLDDSNSLDSTMANMFEQGKKK